MDKNFKQQLMGYMAGNFSCKDIAELITDYLEGSFSLSQRLRFQMHLGLCLACRNYLRQMKYTVATLHQLPSEPVPPHVKEELLKHFRTWKHEQSLQNPSSDPQ
ncbi:MAG: anti-sigma factor [Nitrospirales bacterium]|jgi:anti-sigma factor RsiW|nr:MAG: anti-sigma factor [Nitrospirales bacterium]